MKAPAASTTPLTIREALEGSAPLASLGRRLRESSARFESLKAALPAALHPHVRPGPVDGDNWVLLAANAAVAAKLRQLAPRLTTALQEAGWPDNVLRIHIQAQEA